MTQGQENAQGKLRATLAGSFRVVDDAGQDHLPRGRRHAAVFAYLLAARGRPVARDTLVDLFWSTRAPAQGRASLRQAFVDIRNNLKSHADCFVSDRSTARVVSESIITDLWDQDDTLRLLAGPFFEGLDPVSPVFDEWLETFRREIRRAQISEAEKTLAKGEEDDATRLRVAETLLTLEPTNEVAARAAIELCAALGKAPQGKLIYDRLVEALADDGFAPSPATRAVFEAIKQNNAASAPLPAPAPAPVAAAEHGPPSVFVAEIRDLGADTNGVNQFFAEGLEARLADIPELKSVLESGRADYTISGSLRKSPGGFDLSLRLTRQADGQNVTAFRLSDAFAALGPSGTEIDALVDRAIAKFLPAIEATEASNLSADETTWNAYARYLKARQLLLTGATPDYMTEALTHLEAAVHDQPDFLPPYPYLIACLNSGRRATMPGLDTREDQARALSLARHALTLSANNAHAHLALAWCLIRQHAFDLAADSLARAVDLRPYDAHRVNSIASAFITLGDQKTGERYFMMARDFMLNDLDFQTTDLGEMYFFRKDYEKALSYLTLGDRRNPVFTRCVRAATLAQLGRLDDAQKEASAVLEQLKARWAAKEPFTPEAAIQWFVRDFPMRRQSDMDNLLDGLFKAGFPV